MTDETDLKGSLRDQRLEVVRKEVVKKVDSLREVKAGSEVHQPENC